MGASSQAMKSSTHSLPIAFVATLIIHVLMGGGMYAAGFIDRPPPPVQPVEIEIVEPPRPKEIEKPKPPEPEPPPPKEVEPPKPKVKPRRVARKPRVRPQQAPPPVQTAEPPAPGPNSNNDLPAPVVQIPSLSVNGSGPPVAVGRPKTRRVGPGGTGTNTGGGGDPNSRGTGVAPVSIASIKTLAKPLNPDLDAGKLYPPQAKRQKVEGKLKVRLIVDATGRVVSRRLVTRLGHGLDELALKLAKKLRFEPARDTEDRPVKSVVVWTFHFVLPR